MESFLKNIRRGLRWSLRPLPLLALFCSGLALGLAQTWPAWLALTQGVTQPWIGELAGGGGDALVALLLSGGSNAVAGGLIWLALALAGALIYAIAYNLISGGALSLWAGVRPFWAGCRYNFWSFTGLGALLIMLALAAIAIATLAGTIFGIGVGFLVALLLLQFLNLGGEYARALIVHDQRRNPAGALGRASGFCIRHPGTFLLGLAGFGLHSALGWLATNSAELSAGLALALGQLWAFGWAWLKLVRLGWALAYVQSAHPPIIPENTLIAAVEVA
ncbi:MAG: hypothetical protein HC822_18015 [Oscillochloris sp.]|nr:hypothetical protein [Oscillochloris sp.]